MEKDYTFQVFHYHHNSFVYHHHHCQKTARAARTQIAFRNAILCCWKAEVFFAWNNRTTQWRHEIQDRGAREIKNPKSFPFIIIIIIIIIIKCYFSLV